MGNKRIFSVIAIMVIATLTLGTMIGSGVGQVSLTETPSYSGHLTIAVEAVDGVTVYEVPNLVVTIGKTRVKDYLRVGTAAADDPIDYISLSDDATPLISWTQLPGEIATAGLSRAQGTVADVSNVEFTVSHKFTATGTITAQCSGLQWAASGDSNLWAAATFTQTTLNANDNITITWTVTHN